MDANVIRELQNGLNAAYINGSVAVNLAYKPAFVSNNPEEGKKIISSVEDELLRCDQFQISVAFITMGGVTPLLQTCLLYTSPSPRDNASSRMPSSA